jgi:diguanylate cyclase (GGDEF)-like protein
LAPDELSDSQFLKVDPFKSIKTKIIFFALLATIIPSVSMGWLSYVQNRRSLNDKITQELKDVTAQASRELDLWLKERLYDVRVFSSSYVVIENLEKVFSTDRAHVENVVALRRLNDYLRSVRGKFIDYEELMLLDLNGDIVATSPDRASSVRMPKNWLALALADKPIIGDAYWEEALKTGVKLIAQPIRAPHGRLIGVLAAKLNFEQVIGILKDYAQGEAGELYLITREGVLLVGSHPRSTKFLTRRLSGGTVKRLFAREKVPMKYHSLRGKPVVGALKSVPQLDWGVVAEKESAIAYAQVVRLRNLTLALVAGVLFVVGLCAYLLGLTIVRPLGRLTRGADKVAAGDLNVDLPVSGHNEVSFLTEVFNHMVERLHTGRDQLAAVNKTLRQKNKKLHELSITDSLTGLHNRKHLMETLGKEVARSTRHDHPFSLLIIDIDHFKKYNDTYGHLAGDDVLRKMAAVFRETIRTNDYAARYGGEEFILILPEIGPDAGVQAAERIRKRVAKEKLGGKKETRSVKVSIGVASFPEHAEEAEPLIQKADEALYKAKQAGRNRVILADRGRKKKRSAM